VAKNSTSAQIGYTERAKKVNPKKNSMSENSISISVPFMSVYAGKY